MKKIWSLVTLIFAIILIIFLFPSFVYMQEQLTSFSTPNSSWIIAFFPVIAIFSIIGWWWKQNKKI